MRDLYSDDYESVAGDGAVRLIPEGLRRFAGAAVFLALVAGMGLWSYRLGTRDAAEVPIIRAMEGPTRIEPADPGGLQAAHQGLEVNAVLAGEPAPVPDPRIPPQPAPEPLAAEDAPQGELLLATPAILAERVLAEDGDLAMPRSEEPAADDEATTELAALAPDPAAPVLGDAQVLPPEASPAAGTTRPRNRPSNLVVVRTKSTPVSVTAAPPAAAAAPAARAVQEVASVRPGTRLVQLGAFDSEEITRQAWSQLVARNGDLLAGKSLYVERTTANARVFYRLRVAGFETSEQTRQMCEALRARSIDCIPVTLQ